MKVSNPRKDKYRPNHLPIMNYSDEEILKLGEKMVNDFDAGRGPQAGDFTYVYNNVLNVESDYITCQTCRDAKFKQLSAGIQMIRDAEKKEKEKIMEEVKVEEPVKIITEEEKQKMVENEVNNIQPKKKGRPFKKKDGQ